MLLVTLNAVVKNLFTIETPLHTFKLFIPELETFNFKYSVIKAIPINADDRIALPTQNPDLSNL